MRPPVFLLIQSNLTENAQSSVFLQNLVILDSIMDICRWKLEFPVSCFNPSYRYPIVKIMNALLQIVDSHWNNSQIYLSGVNSTIANCNMDCEDSYFAYLHCSRTFSSSFINVIDSNFQFGIFNLYTHSVELELLAENSVFRSVQFRILGGAFKLSKSLIFSKRTDLLLLHKQKTSLNLPLFSVSQGNLLIQASEFLNLSNLTLLSLNSFSGGRAELSNVSIVNMQQVFLIDSQYFFSKVHFLFNNVIFMKNQKFVIFDDSSSSFSDFCRSFDMECENTVSFESCFFKENTDLRFNMNGLNLICQTLLLRIISILLEV
jgi:hypothetical protein